ncbi:MAG: protein phosphatase 2C domain-containing protein [Myxococcota bacterium]|jgi:serine/threonine protein phosphatase PrpC|nr:protein phosphatase 2C domain-containing protein [Myxococcota bacterium]
MSQAQPLLSAVLLGRRHTEIGNLASAAEGRAAITLSRGGAAKTYGHTDPNEDAVYFAQGEGGWLLAVADGHHGASGAEAVIQHIATELAPNWTGPADLGFDDRSWKECSLDVLHDCGRAVLRRAAELGTGPAPTTLSLALVRPGESGLAWISMGDSHLFRAGQDSLEELGWTSLGRKERYFVGYEAASREGMRDRSDSGYQDLADTRALILATDGLSETNIGVADPARAVLEALAESEGADDEDRALGLAKHLSATAIQAHIDNRAGDNIGCSVLDLRGPAGA